MAERASGSVTDPMHVEFERRAAIARGAIRGDFGEGWMTSGGRDMVRIAAFAGFDIPVLVRRVAMATKHDGMTGPRLVERVMGEMEAEHDAAHPDSLTAATVVDALPEGYRWATPVETEQWTEHAERMVQVRTGGPDDEPWTDLAIRVTPTETVAPGS